MSRPISVQDIYVNPQDDAFVLLKGISRFIDFYNNGRPYHGIDNDLSAMQSVFWA